MDSFGSSVSFCFSGANTEKCNCWTLIVECFVFKLPNCVQSSCTILHHPCPPAMYEWSSFPTSTSAFGGVIIIYLSHSVWCVEISHCGFNLHFLMANDDEHISMWLFAICVFFSVKCFFMSFNHLKINYSNFIFFIFWLHLVASRILVPQPGSEPVFLTLEAQSLNYWTTGEIPQSFSNSIVYFAVEFWEGFIYFRYLSFVKYVVSKYFLPICSSFHSFLSFSWWSKNFDFYEVQFIGFPF